MPSDQEIRELTRVHIELARERMENIGARRLHTVMTTLLEDVLFGLPDSGVKTVKVDRALVQSRLSTIADDEDLRQYIL